MVTLVAHVHDQGGVIDRIGPLGSVGELEELDFPSMATSVRSDGSAITTTSAVCRRISVCVDCALA
jgi:hypothetical protein